MMPPSSKDRDIPIAISLLTRAHSPTTASKIHSDKILHRPLHLKPTEPSPAATQQTLRRKARLEKASNRRKKQKPAPLSSRQKRSLCLYDLPKSAQKYALYTPLHELWVRYIQDLLNLAPAKRNVSPSEAAKLCSADFHGAELEVVRSRCVSRVGLRGIVVKDNMHVFEIVCEGRGKREGRDGDRRVVVPKEGTIFRLRIPLPSPEGEGGGEEKDGGSEDGREEMKIDEDNHKKIEGQTAEEGDKSKPKGKELIFELHGDQFIYRAVDRANRKFKPHFLKNL